MTMIRSFQNPVYALQPTLPTGSHGPAGTGGCGLGKAGTGVELRHHYSRPRTHAQAADTSCLPLTRGMLGIVFDLELRKHRIRRRLYVVLTFVFIE